MNFGELKGKRISVMIDRENGKVENDIGIVEDWDGEFLKLRPNNPNFDVELIYLRKAIIRSIWVYKDAKGMF